MCFVFDVAYVCLVYTDHFGESEMEITLTLEQMQSAEETITNKLMIQPNSLLSELRSLQEPQHLSDYSGLFIYFILYL